MLKRLHHTFAFLTLILFAYILVGCTVSQAAEPTPAPSVPWTPIPVVQAITPTVPVPTTPPTARPTDIPSPTLTDTDAASPLPASATPIPTNTRRPTITPTPTLAVTRISTIIPGIFGGDTATWTPLPPSRNFAEHYLFQRPIDESHTNYWARNYSFGSTDNNSRPVHHGVDFQNELGTPVRAAGDGVVYYAGPDIDTLFGPQPNFYGNVIVIEHAITNTKRQKIYTLYGHLSAIIVKTGQTVKAMQQIGSVGSAGVAIGSHLHFEVRLGNPNDYNAVLNPELWITPFAGNGAIAGRVADLNGTLLNGVSVQTRGTTLYESAYTYADNSVQSDPAFNENFVIPDLPPGYYTVFVNQAEKLAFRTVVYVRSGRTTWLDINLIAQP